MRRNCGGSNCGGSNCGGSNSESSNAETGGQSNIAVAALASEMRLVTVPALYYASAADIVAAIRSAIRSNSTASARGSR